MAQSPGAHRQPHVLVAVIDNAGHFNPMAAIAKALIDKGARVTAVSQGEGAVRRIFEGMGATYVNKFRGLVPEGTPPESFDVGEFFLQHPLPPGVDVRLPGMNWVHRACFSVKDFLSLVESMRQDIDLLFYDGYYPEPYIAAKKFGIKSATLYTDGGLGSRLEALPKLGITTGDEMAAACKPVIERLEQASGVPLGPMVSNQFVSDDMCIGSVMEDQAWKLREEDTEPGLWERFGRAQAATRYVGPCIDGESRLASSGKKIVMAASSSAGAPQAPDSCWELDGGIPMAQIQATKAAGGRFIYLSLGSVIPGLRWEKPVCEFHSGKEFVVTVISELARHFGSTEADGGRDVFVLAVVGNNPDAEEALRKQVVGDSPLLSSWPKNVHIRYVTPQLEALRCADLLVTHGGANSILEASMAEVPMVVVPGQADQFHNARMVHKERWGVGLAEEGSIRSGFMDAVREVLGNEEYQGNIRKRAEEMRAAGGAARAAELLLEYAAKA